MLQAAFAVVADPLETDWDSGEVYVAHQTIQSWAASSMSLLLLLSLPLTPTQHPTYKNGKSSVTTLPWT